MERAELLAIVKAGLDRMRQAIEQEKETELPLFEVRSIGNGFIVRYNDVETFEKSIPVYAAPGLHGGKNPQPTVMSTVRRYRFKRAEVFCADTAAIKVAVEEALILETKVKLALAEDALSDNHDTAVGGF